jgi:hypothetical protein
MKQRVVLMGLLTSLLALTGCHPLQTLRSVGGSCHDVKPYMRAQSVASLKIPAGMDTPDTSSALHVPKLTEPASPPRKPKDPCLDEPPPFQTPKQAPPQA